jgi:hypothetical protein
LEFRLQPAPFYMGNGNDLSDGVAARKPR